MPEINRESQLKLIETELHGALREVAVLKGDTDETQFFFLSEMIISHVEKALQYATVLRGDVMPISDFVEEGNPDPKQP